MFKWRISLYYVFALAVSGYCFLQPVPDDFDRYVYEALVRGGNESVQQIYPKLKHASPRVEQSSVLDSAAHLGQLEPLYAIRPLYVQILSEVSRWIPIQKSINFVSAASLFGIACVLLNWTETPLYSALFLCWPAILIVGRMGTPDALSALVVVAGFWRIARNKIAHGILLLLTSIWVRTDNVLVLISVVGMLFFFRKLSGLYGLILAGLGCASVLVINYLAGNYGWRVLFRYSFVAGKYPAYISSHLTFREYVRAFVHGAVPILPQLAPWILLGLIVWKTGASVRPLLLSTLAASAAHFILFPSGEARYFSWAFVLVAAMLAREVRNLTHRPKPGEILRMQGAASYGERAIPETSLPAAGSHSSPVLA